MPAETTCACVTCAGTTGAGNKKKPIIIPNALVLFIMSELSESNGATPKGEAKESLFFKAKKY